MIFNLEDYLSYHGWSFLKSLLPKIKLPLKNNKSKLLTNLYEITILKLISCEFREMGKGGST